MLPLWLLYQAKKRADGFDAKKAARRRGLVRVAVYVTAVGVLASTCAVHSARARAADATLAVGRELLPLSEAMTNEVTDVSLNGEHVFLSNALSKLPKREILDRYEAHCRANPGEPSSSWRALAEAPLPASTKQKLLDFASLRRESARDGMIVCLERGAGTAPSVSEAFRRFSATHDLGALGKLRMVYVSESPGADTHVLTIWTESSFRFDHLAPPDGSEPPGQDFDGLPRPLGGARMLSARIGGTPYAANVYRSAASPERIADDYDDKLLAMGWVGMNPPVEGGSTRSYQKDGVFVHLGARPDRDGTIVTVGLMGVDAQHAAGAPAPLAR